MNANYVSALLPAYNCSRTVRVVLDRLLASNCENMEIVVVDDASTDDTAQVCLTYPVTVLSQRENRGPAACRNLAVRATRGQLLLFLDSDIDFSPDLLPAMLEYLDCHPHLAGIFTLTSPDPINQGFAPRYFALQEYLRFSAVIDAGTLDWSFISTRFGLLRRNVFEETGGFNESHSLAAYEDLEFSSRMDNRHRLALHKDFTVRHHWPGSVWKILKRLHTNASGVVQFPSAMRMKASTPFLADRNARLLLGICAIFAAGALFYPVLWIGAILAELGALWHARWLIRGCLRHEGWWFMMRAWFVYHLTLIPFVTGIASGTVMKLRQRIKRKAKT